MSNFTNWLSENGSPSRKLLPPNNLRDSLASLFSVQGKRSRQFLSVAFTVLMAVFFSQSSFAQELIVNPGFESKLTGWQSSKNPIKTVIATNPVRSGTYAAHINNSAVGDEYFFQNVNAIASAKYSFSVWAMVHDATKYGSVGVNVFDANWVKISAASIEMEVNTTSFKQYTKSFTVPDNAKYLQVFGYAHSSILKVDDYSLTQTCSNVTNGGTIAAHQTGCSGFDPVAFTSTANPSGGSSNPLEFVWLKSTTSSDLTTATQSQWTTIQGATSSTYDSGPLTQTTYFIRCSRRAGCTDYVGESNVIKVTVSGNCCSNVTSGGTIAAHQSGCSGFDPVAFTSTANPSGGSSNPLEFVWLKSTTSSDLTTATQSQWTTIQGATGSTYDSGPLTQTTYFIRCSRRAGCTDYVGESNVIKVTITGNCCSNVTNGGTIAAHQSGCSGFDPVAFTSVTNPSGGSSNPLEFVWLKSTTSSDLTTATQSQWTTIQGATSSTYDSGPLTQTTYFIRCSRRAGCTDYVGESNVIKVTITGSCGGKDPVCLSRKTSVLNNLLCGTGTTNYGLFFEDLKGNVASPSQYFTVKSGELTEFCDGTAVLNYTACVNGGGANDCINVAVNFSGRTGTPPTGSPVSNTHCTTYSPNVSDWYYYPTSSGAFSGTGIYAGLAGGYTQNMAAFQIGTGGGLNEITKFGASSWFKINITNGGTNKWSTVSTKGDINVNLGASTTLASVTATANPTAICKGESVKLTATLDANSKSANCSPTYSWVGSNGFTSTQATVTNTNVQSATTYTVTVTFTAANGSKCSVTATTGVTLNAVCCDNVTNGGQIAASQSGCAPFDPAPFTEVAAPSGGSGAAEFVWLKSTTVTVLTAANMATDWFAVIGANGATLDVGPLTKTTAYVRCSRRAGCSDYVGESNVIIITVNPSPAAPTVTGAAFCGTNTATLTATCATGATPNWYTVSTGGTAIATGTSYTTPSISTTTSYFVSCKSTAGCESATRVEVKLTVNPTPPVPTVTPATSCGPGSITLGAVCGTGSTANWYAAAMGGSSIATGANYTTVSLSASTTYYVSCKTDLGCESPRVAVKATVIAKITDGGKIQSDENICPGKTPALITSVTPASGGDANLAIEYIWLQTTSLSANGTCPLNIVGQNLYTQIPGANQTDYQPGAITQTTCYIRYARRAGCTDYVGGESNSVKKTLLTNCQGKDPICLSRKTPVLNTVLCGTSTNYGLFFNDLKGSVPTPSQTYSVKSGEFTEFCDGTAVLSYVSCVNGGGTNDCITTTVNFSGRTATPPAGSPVSNTHCSNFMPNVSDWYYYPVSNGTFSGTGIYAGLAGTYAQNMAAFQVGTGGGLNELIKFGGSSWFKINITNGGTNNWTTTSKEGDININLGSSTTIASVTATANPKAICLGESVNLTATVDAASKSANCSPSYSWVGSNGFTSTQATVTNTNVTASTTYTVTVTFTAVNGSKCSVTATTGVTVNPTPATPTVTPAAICGTGTVTLGATCATGATAQWYTTATGGTVIATGPSYTTPSISATTPYYVSCKSPEGCLSARVEVKATVNANGVTPTVKPAAICGTGTVTLGATCSTGSTAMWYSVATGGTVITTGTSYTTPSITATTSYYVSCKTTEGCESNRIEVKATINPIPNAPTVTPAAICGTGTVTLGATCTTGTAQWYAAATGGNSIATGASYTTTSISATTSYYVSCKTTEGCESNRIEVKATINPIPNAPTVTPAAICGTGTVTLGATCATGTAQWYAAATGGNSITTGTSYTTPSISATTSYYVSCKTTEGCESNRIEVKATINPIPNAPTVTPAAICGTGTVTLGATCTTGTAQWYAAATGGNSIATGASYTTTSISATTSYYVSCKTTEGCESNRIEVKATINPIPNAPTVTPAAICGTGTVTLGATCTTGRAQWYAAATGGSSIATGASYTTTSISATTSYYVSCKTTEGCESGRIEVKATINPIPNAPTVTPAAICGTGTVTLGATCTTGTAQWYAAATGGNSIATGASYTTTSISATTSYYVSCKTTEGCESNRIEVKATINPIPNAPTVTPAAICGTGTVTLGATCTTGTAQWYAAATGGSSIATGASYTTTSISATTSYYVSCKTPEGCESNRIEVKATINPIPNAPTVTPAAICGTGTVTLGATCTTGRAQWYAAATGGNSIATGASYTTTSISATTSYYVSCKTPEGCESNRIEVKATINPIPNAPTVTPAAICGTGTVTLGATCTTGTAQWYAAATGGNSIATGASYTTTSISATTSYYVSCKTPEGCESNRIEVKATINPIPNAPTVTPAAICGTGTVTLGATCTTGTAQWYAAATGGNSIATGASYTTTSISATTSYYVSCKTTEGCESNRIEVKATINPIPNAPTVTPAAICGTGTVTLGATCTTGTAQWYAAATGGNSIATGASYTTTSISATTSYYVSCKTTEGCESGRIEVKATINPIPNAPTVTPAAICGTGTVTLGATCTTGTAQWYAAATGGNSIATGASYTTQSISATTSYYVSCKTTEGCESGRIEVKATINPIPNAPTVTPAAICGTGTVTLGATCTTGRAQWYAAATGGNSIATGASYTTTSISATTSYYVSCKTPEGCESNRIEVKATINPIPNAPTVTPAAICGTGTVTLGATCTTGTAQWYAAATGGSSIATGASYTTTSISATTSYYVSCKTTEGCESNRIEVKATINPIPNAPTVTPAAICGTGTVTLGATCTTGTAQWYAAATGGNSIATGASYTTTSISATTSYYVSCKTPEGCESNRIEVKATINPIPNAPTVTPAAICGTGTVTLGATCTTGRAQWYAAATGGNSIATGASYTTTSISATTSYYVSCKTTEGCESGRVEVKATTNGNPTAPTVTPATNCGNGSVTLGAACSAGTPTWYSTATGGIAITTGTSYTTPTLSTTTSYYVSCKSSAGCESARTEVKATIIGKITDGGTIKADEVICVGAIPSKITSVTPASGGDASLAIEYIWLKTTSLTSTGTCPANIAGQNLYTVIPGSTSAEYQPGAITQTTCYIRCARRAGCTDYEGESNAVKKSTEATATPPTVTPAAICGTGTVTLGATCTTGIANWYAVATGGTAIVTGASFTTTTISATTSYYVSCKSANAGCESARIEVKATINPIPAAPTVTPAAICGTGTVTLGATCTTGIAQWYAAATGGSVLTIGTSYTTPSLSTTTSYYVSCKSTEGCESGRTEVKATVNANASAPTVTPAAICGTGTVTLGATCTTGIANWYAAATGGSSIATGATFTTTSISATTSYYVSCKSANAGCESARIEVKATINPIPAAPTVTPAAICGTGTVTLGATCTTGVAQWYAAATGGSVLTTGASYTTPSLSATTSYYVSCKSSAGCESGRTEVKATINAGGTAPTVTPATSCGSGSVTLGATCTSGVAQWYAAATGGNVLTTGASYTTPSISTTTSYYVSCKSSSGCESGRTEVKATIIAKITDGGTIKADETICGSGTPAKITSVTPASGGDVNVAIEYLWLKTTSLTSTGTCPQNVAGQNLYTPIPGATSADYQPGAITQTTCYIRCARRAGCTDYEGESNAVKKTITNLFTITATANPASTCAGGTVNITTTTTATGTVTYTWKGPDGFTASTKDVTLANVTLAKGGVYTVTVTNGSCSAVGTVHVTVTNCLKLGDTVFNDKNNNGKQDAGEPNIPGVTVKLYNSANVLVATTTTDAITGKYLFTNLAPGDYTVEIIAPTGYKSSTGTNGSATGAYEPAGSPNNNVDGDDNGTTVSGQTIRSLPVTLTVVSGDNLTVDFGLFKPASIGDCVFRDLNGDGKQDAGEGGVNGVTVKLYDSANNLVATKTTGPDGKYLFDNLIAGNYTVEFVKSTLASGFNFSPAGTTTPDKDSDANVTTGKTGTITLTEGQNRTDIDAGVTTPCDNDKTPPVMTACPSDILIKTRGTYAYASWTEPTATDNCGTPIVTTTNASGSAFPVGSTTVTYTATDAKGNKVTCSFVVNVVKIITCDVDTQAPVFYDCPTDITVSFKFGTKAIVNWDHPSVGDNCGIPSITYNFEPGQEFPAGTTEVIYTAKDAKGNTSYCKFKINVSFYLVLNTNPTTPVPTGRVAAASSQTEEVSLENQITLYPNPSNTDFAVELSAELMRANSSVEVKVIGTNGNSYFSETAAGKESVSMKVSVETIPSGTYFVNVGLDNGRMIIKKLQIIK